jgi:hypothetical protein
VVVGDAHLLDLVRLRGYLHELAAVRDEGLALGQRAALVVLPHVGHGLLLAPNGAVEPRRVQRFVRLSSPLLALELVHYFLVR